jgi:23S rRNA (guanosine2251-2'-O)-methyltransferase
MRKRKHAPARQAPLADKRRRGRQAHRRGAQAEHTVWLYGSHAVAAALKNPRRAHLKLLASQNALERLPASLPVEPTLTDAQALSRILPQGAVHQGVALLTRPLEAPGLEEACAPRVGQANHVVVLDQVTDPHNVGAVLRSAAAFGARAVLATERHAPAETGALAKAASGALEYVPLVIVSNLAQALERLSALGYWRLGLDEAASEALDAVEAGPNVVIVLGAEGVGLRRLTRERCDRLVRLPTTEVIASLNVSNAAAVALYALSQRTRTWSTEDAKPAARA